MLRLSRLNLPVRQFLFEFRNHLIYFLDSFSLCFYCEVGVGATITFGLAGCRPCFEFRILFKLKHSFSICFQIEFSVRATASLSFDCSSIQSRVSKIRCLISTNIFPYSFHDKLVLGLSIFRF